MASRKDGWDKSKVIISGITAAGVLFGAGVGYSINNTISENDLEVRMLILSVDILRTTPTEHPDEFDKALREWARTVFRDANKKLGKDLPPRLIDQLQTRPLPGPSRGIDWIDMERRVLPSGQNISPGAIQAK